MLCCGAQFLRIFTGTEILSWQHWKCGGSRQSFPTRFLMADTLHSPCCLSDLSLSCTFCASAPTRSLPSSGDGAASRRDWQILLSLSSTHCLCRWELPAEECWPQSVCFPLFSQLLSPCPSCWWSLMLLTTGRHSCPISKQLPSSHAKRLHFLL